MKELLVRLTAIFANRAYYSKTRRYNGNFVMQKNSLFFSVKFAICCFIGLLATPLKADNSTVQYCLDVSVEKGELWNSGEYLYILPYRVAATPRADFERKTFPKNRDAKFSELFERWNQEIEEERAARGEQQYDLAEAVCRKNPKWLDPELWNDVNLSSTRIGKDRMDMPSDFDAFDDQRDFFYAIPISREGLEKTLSWKKKELFQVRFSIPSPDDLSFKNFRFQECQLYGDDWTRCDFTDAEFVGSELNAKISLDQIKSTKNFKETKATSDRATLALGIWKQQEWKLPEFDWQVNPEASFRIARIDVYLEKTKKTSEKKRRIEDGDLARLILRGRFFEPENKQTPFQGSSDLSGQDLSRMNLTDSRFVSIRLFGTDLTDSIITNCDFVKTRGLTLEQLKTTRNWKTGRMDGIALPRELAEEVDAILPKPRSLQKKTRPLCPLDDYAARAGQGTESLAKSVPANRTFYLYLEPENCGILSVAVDPILAELFEDWRQVVDELATTETSKTQIVEKAAERLRDVIDKKINDAGLQGVCVRDCPFVDDPEIETATPYGIPVSLKNLRSTKAWKNKEFYRVNFSFDNLDLELDVSKSYEGWKFTHCLVSCRKLSRSFFSNAVLSDVVLQGGFSTDDISDILTRTDPFQLTSLRYAPNSPRNKNLNSVDLSDADLTGLRFDGSSLVDTNFQGAVVTNCDFQNCSGLTLEQLQSTWNWSVGRMDSVVLPRELREQVENAMKDPSVYVPLRKESVAASVGRDGKRQTRNDLVDGSAGTRFSALGPEMRFSQWTLNILGRDLTGAQFLKFDFQNVKFEDSIVSRCDFSNSKITLSQLQSTWNWKAGRMKTVKLPPSLVPAVEFELAKEQSANRR